MEGTYCLLVQSPIGPLTLFGTESALVKLAFGDVREGADAPSPVLRQAARELEEYFSGKRREFTAALAPEGTAFQRRVWNELRKIPYGTTASYRDIAVGIEKPGAAVAVGQANSRNPIPILIPCHRVIGSDGRMVGYAGGLEIKKALLAVEGIQGRE